MMKKRPTSRAKEVYLPELLEILGCAYEFALYRKQFPVVLLS